MKKRLLSFVFSLLIMFGVLSISTSVSALAPNQPDTLGLSYGAETGLSGQDVRITVARIISVALGLLGILTVLLILYAGFMWMTAAGEEDKIKKAKGILTAAIVGLAIILSAYAITRFVIESLMDATGVYPY